MENKNQRHHKRKVSDGGQEYLSKAKVPEEENKDEPAQDPDRLPNVIMKAEEVLPPETDEECQAAGMSLGQRISRAGKRMEEPKHTISFKDALKKFKSKEELYFTFAFRGNCFQFSFFPSLIRFLPCSATAPAAGGEVQLGIPGPVAPRREEGAAPG